MSSSVYFVVREKIELPCLIFQVRIICLLFVSHADEVVMMINDD